MKGLILSGGKGTRLAPITETFPKQLMPVLGKPILVHCINSLIEAGISEIGIILSPETGGQIEEELKKHSFPSEISFSYIYQDQPLGLGHAVLQAKEFIGDTDEFVMLLGDNLFNKNLDILINEYKESGAESLILLKEVDRPYQFGVAKFCEEGKVQKLVEKPKKFVSNYAIVGVYIFNHLIFDSINNTEPSARGELEITDAIAAQVEQGDNVQVSILDDYWYDTGTREGLLDANKKLLHKHRKELRGQADIEDSIVIGNAYFGENTSIINSKIMGPVFIGDNCKIENSIIGPFSAISANTTIIESDIKEAIIMENTKVEKSEIISSLIFKDNLIANRSEEIINKIVNDQAQASSLA